MEIKRNTGSIFKNSYKTDAKHPDYKGKINVNGEDWEIALWLAESKDGKTKYFSAAISEPYKKEVQAETQPGPPSDDLPF